MNPLEQLLGPEFFALYSRTLARLEMRLGVQSVYNRDHLQALYLAWLLFMASSDRPEEFNPDRDDYWLKVLGSVAVHLSRFTRISFVEKHLTIDPLVAEHRLLLQYYPAQYAALELARSVHMEIYFRRIGMIQVGHAPGIVTHSASHLRIILEDIRRNPKVASNYFRLLDLPTD